jgi:hypothetical protein
MGPLDSAVKTLLFVAFFFFSGCNYQVFEPAQFVAEASAEDINKSDGALLVPNYPSIFQNIIRTQCVSCHKVGGRAEEVPLSSYEDLLNPRNGDPLIVPGDLENSIFYQVLLPEAGRNRMPPPRSGQPPVSDDKIAIVREWILKGAPQN